jgi:hypothetical protein
MAQIQPEAMADSQQCPVMKWFAIDQRAVNVPGNGGKFHGVSWRVSGRQAS